MITVDNYSRIRMFNHLNYFLRLSSAIYKHIAYAWTRMQLHISHANELTDGPFWIYSHVICRIALEAKLPSVQISALEHMHYSHMIRFGNTERAR